MKWPCIVLLFLLCALGCESRREAPPAAVASEPAACSSATAAACAPPVPTAGSATGVDPAQSEVCKHTCATKEPHADRDVVPAAQAKIGDLTRCPVSGVVFRVSAESPQVEHSGRKLRVCCDGCAEKFREYPARFSGS